MNSCFKLAILALALVLAGCSGHPGADTWNVDTDAELNLAKVDVHFEGRAELIGKDGSEVYRCFWAASDRVTLELQCTQASDPDTEHLFILKSEGEKGVLMMADKSIAELSRAAE